MSIKIGKLKLGSRPVIAAALSDDNIRLLKTGDLKVIDLIELRVDMFKTLSEDYVKGVFHQVKKRFSKPVLCTIRLTSEGSRRFIDENKRYALFEAIAPLADMIDIEIQSRLLRDVVRLSHKLKKPVIASYHDLQKTPRDDFLSRMLIKAQKASADITKLAVKADTMDDVARLLRFTMDHKKDNIITISLGDRGRLSRIINPLFGSLITYGYIGHPKADGQMHVNQLVKQLGLLNLLVL
jgi:3-dehydroquinate dehydratase type I